jgi:hypothetical protein
LFIANPNFTVTIDIDGCFVAGNRTDGNFRQGTNRTRNQFERCDVVEKNLVTGVVLDFTGFPVLGAQARFFQWHALTVECRTWVFAFSKVAAPSVVN